MTFNELNLNESLMKAITELNYTNPTRIQEKTIPVLLAGNDVLGCAKTGSGKTAAFALPMLNQLLGNQDHKVRGLIMTPTRELAMQITNNMRAFAKYTDLNIVAIYGGINQEEQAKELSAGADVIVATPGRLIDLIKQNMITLSHVDMLVLDEADQMLDMGFVNDILLIVKKCKTDCQKLMFSATMPKQTMRLADTIMKDAVTIIADEVTSTVDTISQYVYYVDEENKLALLTSLLKQEDVKKAIVFTNTRNNAELVNKHLLKVGIRARAIHSEKSQSSRQDAILQFKNNRIKALVATDVAARGIDIEKLNHVYNYDIPEREDFYIHRIGRTGRAGESGTAISLCSIDQMDDFRRIEAHIKKTIPKLESEWPMRIFQKTPKKQNRSKQNTIIESNEIVDPKTVKDVSLSGKPVKKKSKYQYYQNRFASKNDRYKRKRTK